MYLLWWHLSVSCRSLWTSAKNNSAKPPDRGKTLPTARMTHHSHREIPRERTSIFSIPGMVVLQKLNIPVLWRYVSCGHQESVWVGNEHRQQETGTWTKCWTCIARYQSRMSKDFKECLPLTVNSTRTYFLRILRSQGTSFSVSPQTSLTLPIPSCHSGRNKNSEASSVTGSCTWQPKISVRD